MLIKVSTWSCLRDQNAGQSHSVKIYNNSFEKMEEFKYWGQPE